MKKIVVLFILLIAIVAYAMDEPPVQALLDTVTGLTNIETNQTDKTQMTQITDGTEEATVNTEGRLDVVQHAHPSNGALHFFASGLVADQDFIVVDISDTTNYPHTETTYVHLEWIFIEAIGSTAVAAEYEVSCGFLTNVDATNGDYYVVHHLDGSRATGTTQEVNFQFYPNGHRCRTASHVTGHKSLNDVGFQTDVNLASTLDTTSADTPSGSGDFVCRLDWTAGTVDIIVSAGYHTH